MAPDPIGGALSDPAKRRVGTQIIGQAYVVAHNLARENQDALARIADVLMEKKEIFGDELLDLLDSVGLGSPSSTTGTRTFGRRRSSRSRAMSASAGRKRSRRNDEGVERRPLIEAEPAKPVDESSSVPRSEHARRPAIDAVLCSSTAGSR